MLNIKQSLGECKSQIDKALGDYFDTVIQKARREDVFSAELLARVKTFVLSGGKRLRGALLYYAYLGVGGDDEREILRACVAVELVHSFFLIHDDIMDRDDLRHGVATLHREFADIGKRFFPTTDAEHFGVSMAIIAGDLVGSMGSQSLFSARFPSDRIIEALNRLQSSISRTGLGQAMDIHMEHRGRASEDEVMTMYINKTARYTFESPLHIGAILAGASADILEGLSRYAIPLGIAFQIQDDMLGVYGKSQKTGKPEASDIVEGKMTLLMVKALDLASSQDQKKLAECLEKKGSLTTSDIEEVRSIFERSGSLAYVRNMANKKLEEGIMAGRALPIDDVEAKNFLTGLAEYLREREV